MIASVSNIAPADTAAVLTQPADTVDSVAAEPLTAIVLTRTDRPLEPQPRPDSIASDSWLLGAIALIFCIVCLYYKSNSRYFQAILRDLTDTRERHNLFDDTVRETSFLLIMNLLNACSLSLALYEALCRFSPPFMALPPHTAIIIALASVLAYSLLMPLIYWITGMIFTDSSRTRIWIKGYLASNAIMAIGLFPASLIGLFYPSAADIVLILMAVIFLSAKTMFIFKGMRIFLTEKISWLLFIYYLVGVEIVPLILTVATSLWLTAVAA